MSAEAVMERHRERAEIFHFRFLTRFSIPSDFLLAVLATDGIDDYQGGIAPCRLARTTADAKTLKLKTEQETVYFLIAATQFFQTIDVIRLQPFNARFDVALKSNRRFFGAR